MKKMCSIIIAILLGAAALLTGCSSKGNTLVVGAKDYTEQDVLGNLLTVLLENTTDLKITYKHEMASNIIFAAVRSGDVDVYMDYTGTIYGNYLNYSEMKGADEVYNISVKEMKEKYNLLVLKPLGFNNTYCLAVMPAMAAKYNLKTYTDLAKISPDLIFGGGFEILNRNDGIPNLKKVYNLSFKEEKAIEGMLRYAAIANNETQVTEAFSTDGMLLEFELAVLEDDKSFFPPYHAVPVIREETSKKYPQLMPILDKLANGISDDAMRDMNFQVDVQKKNPREVVTEFLKSKGWI
jgi:glycine betaine/choline ABC-type transport system substrate-binding protein